MTRHEPTRSEPNPFENPSSLNGQPGRMKFAICGFEEQNHRTAPYDDPEWDIAGFNMANRMGFMHDSEGRFRADLWFDLHEAHAQSEPDMAWIHTCPTVLFLPSVFTKNPNAVAYPLAWVMKKIGGDARPYFASSFAYAFALALAQGYTTIGLFGVNLNWGRERIVERGNLEYWIGIAQGAGVEVVFSPDSKLLTHPALYGLEYTKEKEGVEQICVDTIRQLFQTPEMKHLFEKDLDDRIRVLNALRNEMDLAVQRLIYQGKGVA
jgi:hypothetical protein